MPSLGVLNISLVMNSHGHPPRRQQTGCKILRAQDRHLGQAHGRGGTKCLPKAQPDIAPHHQYAHMRKGKENTRARDNDNHCASSKDIRSRNPLFQSHLTRTVVHPQNQLKRTQKRMRGEEKRGKTEVVSVEEDLSCREPLNALNAQLYKVGSAEVGKGAKGQSEGVRLNDSQKLQKFEGKAEQLRWEEEAQLLKGLVRKEEEYSKSKHYVSYLRVQPELTWHKRALVLDWMMLLASQLNCRRDAFANAVNLLDRYLGLKQGIPIQRLQCIAAVCLMISEKLEDHGRKSMSQFVSPIQAIINDDEFLELQVDVVTTLGFKLRAPTVISWSNRLAVQWDLYLDSVECDPAIRAIRFKAADSESYINFRCMAQFIDFSLLDIQTLQYKNRTLAAAFLYLTLLIRLELHTPEKIANQFRCYSKQILEKTPFNMFFSQFLMDSFDFPLEDILPTVQYCSIFVVLPLSVEFPALSEGKEMGFEEYCGIQTYNQMNKFTLNHLNRNFW